MTSAIMILCLAWALSGICSDTYLNIGGFVSGIVSQYTSVHAFIPLLFFLISLGLAFATGTSWGTFGILIPIGVAIFGAEQMNMLVISVAAILSGAVCGDHISPISDTTILSSAGAQCNHIVHVSTQIPYALVVCIGCCAGFLVAGYTKNGGFGFVAGLMTLIGVFAVLYLKYKDSTTV